MNTNNNKMNYKLLLHDMAESVSSNTDIAVDFLEDEGIDVSKYVVMGCKHIKKTEFLATVASNRRRDESLIEKALLQLKERILESCDSTREALISLLKQKAPNVQFRSLDKLNDDEIREILKEVDLVQLLEELDNMNDQ